MIFIACRKGFYTGKVRAKEKQPRKFTVAVKYSTQHPDNGNWGEVTREDKSRPGDVPINWLVEPFRSMALNTNFKEGSKEHVEWRRNTVAANLALLEPQMAIECQLAALNPQRMIDFNKFMAPWGCVMLKKVRMGTAETNGFLAMQTRGKRPGASSRRKAPVARSTPSTTQKDTLESPVAEGEINPGQRLHEFTWCNANKIPHETFQWVADTLYQITTMVAKDKANKWKIDELRKAKEASPLPRDLTTVDDTHFFWFHTAVVKDKERSCKKDFGPLWNLLARHTAPTKEELQLACEEIRHPGRTAETPVTQEVKVQAANVSSSNANSPGHEVQQAPPSENSTSSKHGDSDEEAVQEDPGNTTINSEIPVEADNGPGSSPSGGSPRPESVQLDEDDLASEARAGSEKLRSSGIDDTDSGTMRQRFLNSLREYEDVFREGQGTFRLPTTAISWPYPNLYESEDIESGSGD